MEILLCVISFFKKSYLFSGPRSCSWTNIVFMLSNVLNLHKAVCDLCKMWVLFCSVLILFFIYFLLIMFCLYQIKLMFSRKVSISITVTDFCWHWNFSNFYDDVINWKIDNFLKYLAIVALFDLKLWRHMSCNPKNRKLCYRRMY